LDGVVLDVVARDQASEIVVFAVAFAFSMRMLTGEGSLVVVETLGTDG